MNVGKSIAIVAVLASGLSLSAYAKDKNETKISVTDPVQVGTTQLKPGDYKLQWEGNGPDVQVKVVKGKDVVATVPAKLTAGKNANGGDSITTHALSGDVKALDQVDFAGGKQSLIFGDATSTAANGQQ